MNYYSLICTGILIFVLFAAPLLWLNWYEAKRRKLMKDMKKKVQK